MPQYYHSSSVPFVSHLRDNRLSETNFEMSISATVSRSAIFIHLVCSLKCVDHKTPAGAAEQQSVNCRAEAPNPSGA